MTTAERPASTGCSPTTERGTSCPAAQAGTWRGLDELDRTDGTCEFVTGVAGASSPALLGRPAATGDGWKLRVVSSVLDATPQIHAWDASHALPAAGRQFVLVSVCPRQLVFALQ